MMNFRVIKTSIINILGLAALSRFKVIGFQRQSKNADEVLDSDRFVQIFYQSGNLPKNKASLNGPVQHEITYKIELTVAKQTEGDLEVINNPGSTPLQIATALNLFAEASDLADQSWDELADIVYQILMDARNYDLGTQKGTISNRWIDGIQKDNPLPRGESVILTGSFNLTCQTVESVLGDTGTLGDDYDISLRFKDDPNNNAGVGQYIETT